MNIALALVPILALQQPSDNDLLQAVRNAYEANLANISHGELRFDYTVGRATSPETARRGEWTRTATAPGWLAIDEPWMRYEHIFSPEDTVANRKRLGERRWTSNLFSVRLLTDGVVTLSDMLQVTSDDTTVAHTSSIDSGFDMFLRFNAIPLDIGLKSQGRNSISALLSNAVEDKTSLTEIRYDIPGNDGGRLVEFNFKVPKADVMIAFDLERGAVPRAYQATFNGQITKSIWFDDISRCGPDAWLPFRILSSYEGGLIREVIIRDASFEQPPARSVFQIEYPEPVPMLSKAESVAYTPRQVWRLDNLPPPGSQEAPRVTIRSLADAPPPAPPGERESFLSYSSLGLFALGGVLILTASRMAYRRSRHA